MAFKLIIGIIILYVLYRVLVAPHLAGGLRALRPGGGGSSRFQCTTCTHCGNVFDDGVICRFGNREVFKNETHIRNCTDYQRR